MWTRRDDIGCITYDQMFLSLSVVTCSWADSDTAAPIAKAISPNFGYIPCLVDF